MSSLEDSLHLVLKSNKNVTQKLAIHDSRLEDLENRLRRNSVRIVGFPERVEGNAPVEFIEKWLKSTVGAEHFTSFFCSGTGAQSSGQTYTFWDGPRNLYSKDAKL